MADTPCYYCMEDRDTACAVCIHGELDLDDALALNARNEKLERAVGEINYECQQNGRDVASLKRVVQKIIRAALAECEEVDRG